MRAWRRGMLPGVLAIAWVAVAAAGWDSGQTEAQAAHPVRLGLLLAT